ncbi:MAG TPA: hypothetical protein VMV29_09755 [Ktedonobacterales bacterium]|nr:hypothetical protein [Ktedonobacterales bacterium]
MGMPPNASWPPTLPHPSGDEGADAGYSSGAWSGRRLVVPGDAAAPDDATIPALMTTDTRPIGGGWGGGRGSSAGGRTPPALRRPPARDRRRTALLLAAGALIGLVAALAALLLAQLGGLFGAPGASGQHGLFRSATATTAPTATATPVLPLLTGRVGVTPSSVNLTTGGAVDWAHWGLTGAHDFDHKATGGGKISDYTVIGHFGSLQYGTNPAGFTWTDGTPTASALNSTTGVYTFGEDSGFSVTVPADLTTHTLTIYVGVFVAHGSLSVSLSDHSAPTYTDNSLVNSSGVSNGMYTITYRAASAGQTLTVTFTDEKLYAIYGNVELQAATLA